ncbi:MAG: transporter substrate-binding domain-containing protein [Candidatus Promineofilum sp.]|nr:transporter substrate-binding domain-containing protein [Promineifilum sp.]
MKRLISVMLVILIGSMVLAGCASGGSSGGDLLSDIQKRGKLRISTDPNYEPQSFLDAEGNFTGFDVDVAREIAKRLGVEAEFVTPDWDVITAGNWAGQWDISVGSMTVTTARQKVLDFASPAYYYTPAQFAAADGSGIDTLADVNGQAVCVAISTTYETWLNGAKDELGLPEENFYAEPPTGITVIPLPTDAECPQSIQSGRQDFQVFLTSNTVVEAAIGSGIPVHKVGTPVFSENLAAAFDKQGTLDNASTVKKVGEIIQAMHDDGTLRELSMKWFGADLTASPTN